MEYSHLANSRAELRTPPTARLSGGGGIRRRYRRKRSELYETIQQLEPATELNMQPDVAEMLPMLSVGLYLAEVAHLRSSTV